MYVPRRSVVCRGLYLAHSRGKTAVEAGRSDDELLQRQ